MVLLVAVGAYGIPGLVFAIVFVACGAGVVDPAARLSPWHVRLLWLPGAVALWPLLFVQWRRVVRRGGL